MMGFTDTLDIPSDLESMLGLSPRVLKFVKRFGDLGPSIEQAVKRYAQDVSARHSPGAGLRLKRAEETRLKCQT
jgi:ketopantoate hydroxymethyltransferase